MIIMRKSELSRKRSIANQEKFYMKMQQEIERSGRRIKNARLRRGLYKQFYEEFKVLLDYAELKFKNNASISFKWVGEEQQGKKINYDGEIYCNNVLIEKVEVTCPLISKNDKIIAEELNKKGYSSIEVGDLKEKLDDNNIQIEAIAIKKNNKKTYDNTITLVVYVEDLKHYYTGVEECKQSIKDLKKALKKIAYQFKEVYIIETLYMNKKKNLVRIK